MIGGGYLAIGGALAICLAGASGFFYGEGVGENKIKAEDAKEMSKAYAARDKSEANLQAISLAAANANVTRESTFREITREVPKIIERPVYSNQCIDADGVRLLTRAARAANGERDDTGSATGGPSEAPNAPGKR